MVPFLSGKTDWYFIYRTSRVRLVNSKLVINAFTQSNTESRENEHSGVFYRISKSLQMCTSGFRLSLISL
jgi:hypothetical protein